MVDSIPKMTRKNLSTTATNALDSAALLTMLEIPLATNAFPARLLCPLCRQPKLIVYDTRSIFEPAWHRCSQCQSHGDLIELAARVWGCQPETACRKLNDLGMVPFESVEPYIARLLHRRRELAAFVEEARQR
jgi:hypothetical protein